MSKYGSNSLTITYDSHDVTAYVTTFNGISIEALTQDSQAFGTIFNEASPTGTKKVDDITLGGIYDDVANGPKALWGTPVSDPTATPKNLVITWGGTNQHTIPVYPVKFLIKATKNELHSYEATLRKGPGSVTVV